MADETDTPTPAAKPAATRRRAPRKTAAAKAPRATAKTADTVSDAASAKPTRAKAAAKPRSTKRATTTTPKRRAAAKPATKPRSTAKAKGESSGWSKAAVVGGIAVVGAAATAALLTLRGSTPEAPTRKRGAHTADGSDASASFRAGIADEGTIPEKS